MCMCGGVKNRIVTCEICIFVLVKKGMSELGRSVNAKHTINCCKFNWKSDIFIYRQSGYWDMKFDIWYLLNLIFQLLHNFLTMTNQARFAVNQRHIDRSPKITKIF